jgi:hypothetical protein
LKLRFALAIDGTLKITKSQLRFTQARWADVHGWRIAGPVVLRIEPGLLKAPTC